MAKDCTESSPVPINRVLRFSVGHNGVACDASKETIPMKPPTVSIVSDQCKFEGERYRAAKLEDDTYAFVAGNVPVFRRLPLPMELVRRG